MKLHRSSGRPFHERDRGIHQKLYAFIAGELLQTRGYILVFSIGQPVIPIDNRHRAAEAAHRLCELQAHVTATKDDEMLWQVIELQRLNVSQGIRFSEAWDVRDCRASAGADHDFLALNNAGTSLIEGHLKRFGPGELCGAHDQLRAAGLEIGDVNVHQACDHLALAAAHDGHVDFEVFFGDSELFASSKIRSHLRAVNDVLAGQTGDIGA